MIYKLVQQDILTVEILLESWHEFTSLDSNSWVEAVAFTTHGCRADLVADYYVCIL